MSRETCRTWVFGLFVILLGLLGACSKSSASSASSVLVDTHGHYHTSNWMSVHAGPAIENVANCTSCHEMTTLRSSGGAPSCATTECHHKTIPGFALAGSHGARAKLAQTASGGGLVSCQVCHSRDFSGGASGKACSTCHVVKAPHPLKPWRNASGNGFAVTHSNTDPSNAAVCGQCHYPGSPNNPLGHPASPASAGAAPGCFNNTLCHANNVAPHAMGSIWKDPTSSAFHGFEAKKDLAYCQSCHGTPGTTKFDGGVAPTACSSCHTAAKAHSKPWYRGAISTFPGYVASHRNAGNKDVACALCHDVVKIRTAPNPAAPSCFSDSLNGVGCHANGPGQPSHAVPFLDTPHTHVVQSAFDSNCANCHAVTGASPLASAPTCITCHQSGSPLALSNCTSCHAKPPSGSAFPNNAGKHAKHLAVAGAPTCSACHNGVESGTLTHYDHANGRPGDDALRNPPAPVSTQATFNAKAGPAAFNPATLTCSNISCHGGKPAPNWQTGSIDSSSDAGCRACHTLGTALGVPENNSPYSGTHALHLGVAVAALCTDCHAMGTGTTGATNHFKFLGTTQMEGPASDTIAPMGNPAYYKPSDQTCGTFTCHEHLHTKISWQGGPNHAVPYLGAPHTTTTQGSFDLDCKSCHAVSTAPSPLAAAPLCSACHQGGSPLSLSNCLSCHAKPPSGSAFPDIAGKHAKHESLAGITGACSSCHETFDSGTREHYDHGNGLPGKDGKRVPPAPMKAMSDFNAKSGTASLDPATLTCSNISCHGGIKTPSWQNGSIDSTVDAGCRQCHSLGTALGVPERNSLYSGMHALHLGTKVNALCTECHAMGNGSTGANNHFKFLHTPQMEGPASGTVAPMGNPAYYKPSDQTCGTFTCHGHAHGGISWDGGANHAIPYLDSKHTGATQASFDADCKACHGLTGTVSPITNAPTCVTCHQAGSPLSLANCSSCHAKPPAGTVFPDVAGKHTKHNTLAGVTNVCAACHTGSESGSQVHYDHANARPGRNAGRVPPAPVAGAASYNAKAGTSSFNPTALTCSNVSCHGGVITPSWANGTINSATDAGCVQCHKAGSALGVPESNSYYSGLHSVHMAAKVGAVCSECHGMANGTAGANNHFKFLGTTQMEGPAADTVMPMGNASWYQAPAQTCGTFTCHGQLHTNYSWKGGANHAIPFLGTSHTGINSGTAFTSSCASCHGLTGTVSPIALAPTCSTCHQAGTPTTLANCASCHAKPPTGTVFPDVAGKHAKHNALAGVANVCAACHTGSDTGSQTHYDHANARTGMNALRLAPGEVAGSGAYNAKAGAASFNPATLTCANVSCHGGVLAPSWATGSISSTLDSGCVQCHKAGTALGLPENNSFYSGLHGKHLATPVSAVCSECHLMANGTVGALNHFKFLGTSQMEGPASDTVVPMGTLGNASWYQASTQSCGTFTCHGTLHTNYSWKGGANHAIPFLGTSHTGINSGTSFNTSCASCHGLTGATSPMALAPTCSTCHQAGTPTTLANCASCHAKPPTGSVFPDVAGKHAKHDALAGVANVCAACHTGSDTGSQTHYDHANARTGMNALRLAPGEVAGSGAYNAKAGAATFNPAALTCANVSCHGGILAPSWATGSISSTLDSGCVQCHKAGTALGLPENNSFYSGMHGYHLAAPVNAACSECHLMANGTVGALNHFKFLGTPQMEGPASDTVVPMGTLGNASWYQAPAQTCGTFTCHSKLHTNYSWKGGANHAIPFLGTSHTGINSSAAFTTNCSTCHAQTGTASPMVSAPTCITCHQAGTPTSLANCTSCHAKPPIGTVFPSIAGTHAIHNSFTGVTGNCDACHTGSGTGSSTHYDHANARPGKNALRVAPGEVAGATTFNAKSGAATWNSTALTCGNVSCHGGQTTPNWQTGSINVNTQCTSCHTRGTTQYNSQNSGEHKKHETAKYNNVTVVCADCHNTTTLATNHFTSLGTTAMEGPASATIGGGTTRINAGNYSSTTGNCTPVCHQQEKW